MLQIEPVDVRLPKQVEVRSPSPCHQSQSFFGLRRRSPRGSLSTSTKTTVPLTTTALSHP